MRFVNMVCMLKKRKYYVRRFVDRCVGCVFVGLNFVCLCETSVLFWVGCVPMCPGVTMHVDDWLSETVRFV